MSERKYTKEQAWAAYEIGWHIGENETPEQYLDRHGIKGFYTAIAESQEDWVAEVKEDLGVNFWIARAASRAAVSVCILWLERFAPDIIREHREEFIAWIDPISYD